LPKIYCQQSARQPGDIISERRADIISESAGDIVGIRSLSAVPWPICSAKTSGWPKWAVTDDDTDARTPRRRRAAQLGNPTDCDREGQLIGQEILEHLVAVHTVLARQLVMPSRGQRCRESGLRP
jgi:hypothetical protein